ncbi:hypothetical protein M378DRAFT_330301 [Amanita muscaria Koide BX008]|uniref:Uncharacterized protein n=1 Tax=Amanita muscaria (strain Koide BX008) TaxID=946122 RepID=A0A0C2SUP5_AMAMK|nr:hypothetical protein M378DRAFT_330301 [Amanita muscaria Koide BX008]
MVVNVLSYGLSSFSNIRGSSQTQHSIQPLPPFLPTDAWASLVGVAPVSWLEKKVFINWTSPTYLLSFSESMENDAPMTRAASVYRTHAYGPRSRDASPRPYQQHFHLGATIWSQINETGQIKTFWT